MELIDDVIVVYRGAIAFIGGRVELFAAYSHGDFTSNMRHCNENRIHHKGILIGTQRPPPQAGQLLSRVSQALATSIVVTQVRQLRKRLRVVGLQLAPKEVLAVDAQGFLQQRDRKSVV